MAALTKEQLDRETREWREHLASRGHDVDIGVPAAKGVESTPMTKAAPVADNSTLITGIMAAVAPLIHELQVKNDALTARVAALETSGSLRYLGVWQLSATYVRGDIVTHDGSAFHCVRAVTGERPGTSDAFQLMIKHGKDAVVSRSDAATANTRVNGHYSQPRTR
jgi:hypothetical protein